MELKATDRILLLSITSVQEVREIAKQVSEGLLVAVVDSESVYEARSSLRDFANVMITPRDSSGAIPWADEFFSVVRDTSASEPSAEMLRVTAPGGAVLVLGGAVIRR